MVSALATDLLALPGVELTTLADHRLTPLWWPSTSRQVIESVEEDWSWFTHLARVADWTVVIAPEFDRLLARRCQAVEGVGGRLLGPGGELVELAANKTALCAHLAEMGIATPPGIAWDGATAWPQGLDYPVVLKPNDGAGSQDIAILVGPPEEAAQPRQRTWRIERYQPGLAASVAVLAGPAGYDVLQPCRQRLSGDGRLTYQGGSLPLPATLNERARELARRVVAALSEPFGYFGIDLILGADPEGHSDCVVEVNPRLTTSYVGLRRACRANLAGAMLDMAGGRRVDLSWHDESLEFDVSGEVRIVQPD